MRAALVVLSALAVSGCATSAAGLANTAADRTLTSAKTPKEWAICAAETLQGSNELRDDGVNWWVIRSNGYGVPIVRWDFKPAPNGSVAELRSSLGTSNGVDKVEVCGR
tara:strand:+ start:105 stop:431 length:327 start_codon:yes stop_codon:yes gene_type:complete